MSDGLGRGSEFVIRLPALPDDGDAPPSELTDVRLSTEPQSLRVVVVDDNADGADTLADLLRSLGHEVRVAYDGVNGIAITRDFHPDLVLLDIGLPGMDGYEVARRLRATGNGAARAVLVAVSGYGQETDRARAREAGFAHHCVKPVEFEALQNLLVSVRPLAPRAGSA